MLGEEPGEVLAVDHPVPAVRLVVFSRPSSAHRRTVSTLTPSSSAAWLGRNDGIARTYPATTHDLPDINGRYRVIAMAFRPDTP